MKLAEALSLRADLSARLSQLAARAAQNARAQEGEVPLEDPLALLAEHARLADELEALIRGINRTNLTATLADGTTLTDALARRDVLRLLLRDRRSVADRAAERGDRYSQSEIRWVATVDVPALRADVDAISKELRVLDTSIQEANWSNQLTA